MAERRKRLNPAQTAAFLADLAVLPFVVDESPIEAAVLHLARRHTLTVYDAAYLELAQRQQAPLATLDAALIKAAKSANIATFKRLAK